LDFHWRPFFRARLKLPLRANAGLVYGTPAALDLDFAEWFLSHPRRKRYMGVVEQTVWAGMCGNAGGALFGPRQVLIPARTTITGDVAILHAFSYTRGKID